MLPKDLLLKQSNFNYLLLTNVFTGNGGFLCLGCEKGGKSVEEARAAQEETAKRFVG